MIASISSWCTPTVLFCVSNLIIATLFISSKSSNTKTIRNRDPDNNSNKYNSFKFTSKLPGVSSFLERAKSIDISKIIPDIISIPVLPFQPKIAKYTSSSRLSQSIFSTCSYDNQPDIKRYSSNKPNPSSSILERLKSIDFSSIYNTKANESEDMFDSLSQLGQDRVNSVAMASQLVKVNGKIPVKKSRSEVRDVSDDDDDVDLRRTESARDKMNAKDDAKAQNFINKFRDQLKLQRLDSLERYNDMLNGVS